MRQIELSELPGVSDLFRDYTLGEQQALDLFLHDPYDPDSVRRQAESLSERDYDRQNLSEVLTGQNQTWGAEQQALDNCILLGDADCMAVVTGQQVGLPGGPMYTLIKALHTIRLAALYENELGLPVVPIFWLELEDHDIEEVSSLTVKDSEHRLTSLRLEAGEGGTRRPVKDILLGPDIDRILNELAGLLPRTEYGEELFKQLRRCYTAEASFAEAFARLLTKWLSGLGLVLADPSHPHLKMQASNIFAGEIEEPGTSRQRYLDQLLRIAASGYSEQVTTRAGRLQLFLLVEGEKYRIAADEEDFALEGSNLKFDRGEILKIVEEEPQRLVPSVLLRPIVQDTLFPTLAYIGGPAEVSYFAQATPLYQEFGVDMPLIMPRSGVTLVGSASRRTLETYSIELTEIFQSAEDLTRHVIAEHVPEQARLLFRQAKLEIAEAMARLKLELDPGEDGFAHATEAAAKKVRYHLDKLEDKYMRAVERKNEVLVSRLFRLSNTLFPGGSLQERVFSIAQVINTYGSGVINAILESIDPTNPTHLFIDM